MLCITEELLDRQRGCCCIKLLSLYTAHWDTVSGHTNTQRFCKTKEQMKTTLELHKHTHIPLNKHYKNNRILPSYCSSSLPGNDTVDTSNMKMEARECCQHWQLSTRLYVVTTPTLCNMNLQCHKMSLHSFLKFPIVKDKTRQHSCDSAKLHLPNPSSWDHIIKLQQYGFCQIIVTI